VEVCDLMKARYVNPYTDFGFKKLFGEEANKDLLKDFLNELLPVEHKIVELNFKNTEQWGDIAADRRAIFDLHCENANGERFIIEMPCFTKEEHELETHFDKWLYFLKHLEDFEDIPGILNEEIFVKAFRIAEIANFTPEQLGRYEESLKTYRDLKGVVDTSYEEGKSEGRAEGKIEGKIEIALKMKKKGEPAEKISEYTGLSIEEINQLKPTE
jgi:hypothetical protein